MQVPVTDGKLSVSGAIDQSSCCSAPLHRYPRGGKVCCTRAESSSRSRQTQIRCHETPDHYQTAPAEAPSEELVEHDGGTHLPPLLMIWNAEVLLLPTWNSGPRPPDIPGGPFLSGEGATRTRTRTRTPTPTPTQTQKTTPFSISKPLPGSTHFRMQVNSCSPIASRHPKRHFNSTPPFSHHQLTPSPVTIPGKPLLQSPSPSSYPKSQVHHPKS